jgi:hypothetical protein
MNEIMDFYPDVNEQEIDMKVSYHNKQAMQSYDGVMVSVIVSSAVDLRG